MSSVSFYNVGVSVTILDGQILAVRDSTCYNTDGDCKLITKTQFDVYLPYDSTAGHTQLVYPTLDYGTELTFGGGVLPDGVLMVVLSQYTEDGLVNKCISYILSLYNLEMKMADLLQSEIIAVCECKTSQRNLISILSAILYAARIKFKCEQFAEVTALIAKANELIEQFDCDCT